MKSFYEWYRKHITGAIFGGLILGILTGLFLAGRFKVVLTATSVLGSIYMSALNMMIFPLVFCSIVMGIASIGSNDPFCRSAGLEPLHSQSMGGHCNY